MQNARPRCVILVVILLIGALVQAGFDGPRPVGTARWPTDDGVYGVDGWAMGPLVVESAHGVHHVIRAYHRADGASATLVLSTSPEAKRIYRAGADVPFLSSGYTVDPAPPTLVPPVTGLSALLVRRERELGLLLHTTGERRGLLGNGALGWSAVVLDAVAGRLNDYYLARILLPLDQFDAPAAPEATALAGTLFPRLAAWYAD